MKIEEYEKHLDGKINKVSNLKQRVIVIRGRGLCVSGNAGLKKHYEDIVDILSNHQTKDELIDSVINIVNNKTELGLMNIPIVKDDIMGIEILFLLADFNVKSKRIENEVRDITKSIDAKIVFTSSKQTAIDYSDAKDLFDYEN